MRMAPFPRGRDEEFDYCACGEWRVKDEPCENCGDYEEAQDWRPVHRADDTYEKSE
jgi:hypothetical protein